MNLNQAFRGGGKVITSPVFDGLEKLGFSGIYIAEIARVSPPTISKWRYGYVIAPNEFIVFLTLVLASRLLDVIEQSDYEKVPFHACTHHQRGDLESVQEDLKAQEKINYSLPSSAVREGAIRYRYWWHTQKRLKISKMRMNVEQANRIYSAY